MKITRRQAMIGAAAVGMTLPVVSSARPISPSPLLKVFADNASLTRIDFFKVHENPTMPPLHYDDQQGYAPWFSQVEKFYADRSVTFPVTCADGVSVNSVEEAEDILLRNLPEPCSTSYPQIGPPPTYVGDYTPLLAIILNRSANLIQARTRLVGGDTVLLSCKSLQRLVEQSDLIGAFQLVSGPTLGRWQRVGLINNTMWVFVGEHLSDDQVFVVATKGDNHALLIQSTEGLHLVTDQGERAGSPVSMDFFINVGMSY